MLLLVAGCGTKHDPRSGNDPRKGKELIARYGCGSCYEIKGVPGANATVGVDEAGARDIAAYLYTQ